jgi:hypothetical protein
MRGGGWVFLYDMRDRCMDGREGVGCFRPGWFGAEVHGEYSDSDFVSFRLCLVDSYDTASHHL